MDVKKEGKQADLQETKITRYHHDILRKKVKMSKLWSRKKWGWDTSKNIFIGDSAATSHMTSRKLGVYDFVPING